MSEYSCAKCDDLVCVEFDHEWDQGVDMCYECLYKSHAEKQHAIKTLFAQLRDSTDELLRVLMSGENIARYDIKNQIAANEAALKGVGDE